jgi:penicillin amidase
MERETTRRAVLGAVLGAGVAGGLLSPASTYLRQFAPLSGSVWGAAETGRRSTVDSPHGPAEVRYDDEGVPHVTADDEAALYYAAGYVQTTDRLFQMDLQRRQFRGQLSAVVGDVALDSDRFHREMLFADAAETTAEHVRETPAGPPAEAYVDGVNAAIENESLPLEFRLLDYEPEPWTLADSMIVEKLIAWNLTGSFRTLRKALVTDIFGAEMADQLYPDRFENRSRIVRDRHDPDTFGAGLGLDPTGDPPPGETVDRQTVDRFARFEPAPTLGSNSWLVGPELSDGDAPLVSNDPHLQLQAPPVWYEMHLDGPDHRVRGVSFPGVPFVVIGENDHGAWGFTNVGADVIDFYTYETDETGRTYEYGDETREFETETEEIAVDGGSNETVEVRRSVHGPVVTEAEQEVGVAWTGHAATETTLAIYELTHSETAADVREAAAKFEAPTQNLVYGNSDGDRLFRVVGRLPVRRIDGDVVRGDRVFDGSAPEGEWGGFDPFERPPAWDADPDPDAEDPLSWVPVAENPHVENPSYLATANQLTVDDDHLAYYLGVEFDPGYRGERIYDLLDERVDTEGSLDQAFLRDVGRDTRDGRAARLADTLVAAAREGDTGDLTDAADTLDAWDHRMDPDSEGALLFDRFLAQYRDELFAEAFDEADLDDDYYPTPGVVEQLPPDSPWFGPRRRGAAMRTALRAALAEIDEEGHEVYGDVAHTGQIGHPLELDFLAYPEHPRGGSSETVQNFDHRGPRGGSWEMQVDLADDGEYLAVLPGGNSGRYFSDHYDDQIARWARGEYRSLSRTVEGDLTVEFEGTDG